MAEEIWVATPAFGAPYVAHLLPDPPRQGRGRGGTTLALCGEGRARWQPVKEFAVPTAFTKCEECRRLAAVDRSRPHA